VLAPPLLEHCCALSSLLPPAPPFPLPLFSFLCAVVLSALAASSFAVFCLFCLSAAAVRRFSYVVRSVSPPLVCPAPLSLFGPSCSEPRKTKLVRAWPRGRRWALPPALACTPHTAPRWPLRSAATRPHQLPHLRTTPEPGGATFLVCRTDQGPSPNQLRSQHGLLTSRSGSSHHVHVASP
jgi:hypothetical protein